MVEIIRVIQEKVPLCMLFADDIVLVDKSLENVNNRLNKWRVALEGKLLRISKSKQNI